jgi:hypothetical protein
MISARSRTGPALRPGWLAEANVGLTHTERPAVLPALLPAQLPEQEAADDGRDGHSGDVADGRDGHSGDVADGRDVQVTQPAEDVTHEERNTRPLAAALDVMISFTASLAPPAQSDDSAR